MFKEERLIKIINIMEEKNEPTPCVKIDELTDIFNVSSSTIRRDLDELESRGHINRTHGGAILANSISTQYNFVNKQEENYDIKNKIAMHAASLIEDDDIIAINTSTLTYLIINHIKAKNVKIVTNSIELVNSTPPNANYDIILLGGMFVSKAKTIEGSMTVDQINKMYFNKVFLGANGIDVNQGITTAGPVEVGSKKAMIKNGEKSYFLCESSKFDKISFYKISDFTDITGIITDTGLNDEQIDTYKNLTDLTIV